jgi:hypothetical protein
MMKTRSVKAAKLLSLLLVIGVSVTFLIKGASRAQEVGERELVDTTPKHVPIKIKVKTEKERAFKDLQNVHWLRDLEIEVTNIGDKPIYFLLIVLEMGDIKAADGTQVGYPLHYGQLTSFKERPKPEDVPIWPGETFIFKLPESYVSGFERGSREANKPTPTKVRVLFQRVNFGDGTGYQNSSGSPFPNPRKMRA